MPPITLVSEKAEIMANLKSNERMGEIRLLAIWNLESSCIRGDV